MVEESRGTVLAVDDNEILRYSIKRILLDAGFSVIEAKSGREALQLAANNPDLITLDINLPDMDGFEVCRELKLNPVTSHIPILHVSGTFIDPEYRVKGLQGGADGYLAEPFDPSEFVATIEALLRVRRAEKHAIERSELANSARARMKEAVDRQSEEIRKLNANLIKLQDEERRRIARELHDSTGQLLALLSMNLSRLEETPELSESARKLVNESSSLSRELTSQLRTVAYLLHPPLLDEIGLASAVEWYVHGFSERSGIDVALTISENFGRLDSDTEIAIFRIIQECLTNVHKHSESKTASVELRRHAGLIRLDVKDAGTKFTADNTHLVPGTGLLGMSERVRQLGGELRATAGPSGTHISVTAPFGAARRASQRMGTVQ